MHFKNNDEIIADGLFVYNELNKPHKDKYVLHKTCEAAIHKQIDEEMHASLVYATMAAHFDHNTVARKGLAKFFAENSVEEREHAHKFIDYLNSRGARFSGFDVKMPSKSAWNKAVDALQDAANLEKHVNNKLYHLHDIAALQCVDQHLMDFLESEFFDEQVKSIDKLQRYISILSSMEPSPLAEFLFDQQLQGLKTEL
ncbi:ferritin, middle subunit-like isoform X2 [Stegodyphus dumicola]|uniref:ferritin, middle subunit-like isoform X2 n=1 Tax=Stegodyphus dumicola TaxID=202533 RepID=UPI0015B2A99F|nr:ferritin, middle subunit-like isoform X2 [Stegodyphus dumicola]